MIWLAAAVPALTAVFVLAAWPYHAWGRAGRLAVRADGSLSPRRRTTERSQRWRVVVRGGILPVVVAALLGGVAFAIHAWAPWNAAAAVFGTANPETDLVARSLVERVEARAREAAEETANAVPDAFRVPGQVGVRDWLFEHFPLHPIGLAFLVFAYLRLARWVVVERRRYLDGLGRRMRAYQRQDLRRLRHRDERYRGEAAPPV